MNVLVKILIVFDLLCFAIYFGGDILSTALAKLRKKPAQKELFEFYEEDADTPLSVDSIRQLYSGEVDTFVEEKLLPDGESTAEVLTERELAAAACCCAPWWGFWWRKPQWRNGASRC